MTTRDVLLGTVVTLAVLLLWPFFLAGAGVLRCREWLDHAIRERQL